MSVCLITSPLLTLKRVEKKLTEKKKKWGYRLCASYGTIGLTKVF